MATTVLANPPSPPGDEIGLSIAISRDEDKPNLTPNSGDDAKSNGTISTFIPPSVEPSPIPFEVGDDDGDGNGETNHNTTNNISTNEPQSTTTTNEDGPSVSSIMREPSSRIDPSQSATTNQSNSNSNADQSHVVAALEERVRDLEEKLSTLSMLLMQQNQRLSPRNTTATRKPSPTSPESSSHCDDSSSLSPPITPFRSLASFATIPSSNVPVLESPTPVVVRRFRSHTFSGSLNQDPSYPNPHSHHDSPLRGSSRVPQSQLRRGLSYHILHTHDSQLDLRNASSSRSDGDDAGSIASSSLHSRSSSPSRKSVLRPHDDSFEKACRVPTLDSLPGSSRSSPILSLSNDSMGAGGVLSPDHDDHKSTTTSSSLSSPPASAGAAATTTTPTTTISKRSSPHASNPFDGSSSTLRKRHSKDETDPSAKSQDNNNNANANANEVVDESKHKKKKSNIKSKWLDYLNSVQDANYDTDKQMEEFVKVPSAVEALLSFGFWISVDSFLYTLTMLPLRSVYSIFLLNVWVYKKIVGGKASETFQFHRHNSYHLIQVSIIYIIYRFVLKPIDISIMYHMIRNQSMVKLYLLVAIVEVFDRLMCSLGQDCLDSLYWNTTRRPRSSRLIVSALVVLVYTALHSFLLFVHVATLNVAMNSDDQALLSLLIGGNFAEIKSTVFKKYNKATLFKITASDICERFKLALFLFLVLMLNASQGMDSKMYYNYLSMCGIVVGGEWLSDWLKHSFITKFNYIASGVYSEYGLLLAGDVSGFGHEAGANLDKSHAVVKRLGLAQIPLVCVMTKYLKEAYKYQTYENQPKTWWLVVGALSVWLLLLVTKLSLASLIQRMSRNKLEAAPEFSKHNAIVAKKKNH